MRKRALLIFAIVVAAAVALASLLENPLVERLVETLGGGMAGADVEVENADFSLLAGRLRLEGVAVADRRDPSVNLFEAEEALLDVSVSALLKRRMVVEEARLTGLRWRTPRRTEPEPAEPRRKKEEEKEGEKEGKKGESGPGLLEKIRARLEKEVKSLPISDPEALGSKLNPAAIAKEGKLKSLEAVEALVERGRAQVEDWERRLEKLEGQKARLKAARDSVAAIRPSRIKDPLSAIEALKTLKDAFDVFKKAGKEMEKAVKEFEKTAFPLAGASPESLRRLVEKDVAFLKDRYTFGGFDAERISRFLFGEKWVDIVEGAVRWVDGIRALLPKGPAGKVRRFRGVDVQFETSRKEPLFLVKKAVFSLDATQAADVPPCFRRRYTGVLAGLTFEPALYGKPLRIDLESGPGDGSAGAAAVRLRFDLTKPETEATFEFKLRGCDVSGTVVGAKDFPLTLERAEASLSITGALAGDRLEMRVECEVGKVEFGFGAAARAETPLATLLKRELAKVRGFRLTAVVETRGGGMRWRLSSDLGETLAGVLKDAIAAGAREAERACETYVRNRVAEKLKEADSSLRKRWKDIGARLAACLATAKDYERECDRKIKELRKKGGRLRDGWRNLLPKKKR